MPWKEMSVEKLAKELNVDVNEVREKQNLISLIVKERKSRKMSQVDLAKKVGVTQGRIAQIESGVGTARISFDVLLSILTTLGFAFKIVPKKAA